MTLVLLFLAVGFGLGLLVALAFMTHLAWFWVTGQDYRTPEERGEQQVESGIFPQAAD